MVVPYKFTFEFSQFYLLSIEISYDLWAPGFIEQTEFFKQVYFFHTHELISVTNCFTFSMSLIPGDCSKRLLISTTNRSFATGSLMNSFTIPASPGSIPPLRKNGLSICIPFNRFQLNFLPVPPYSFSSPFIFGMLTPVSNKNISASL